MLVFDVECIPLAASMAEPYPEEERTPPGNYKSEEAIAKWRAADREKWDAERVKAYSLSPRTGRVVCIGYGNTDGDSHAQLAKVEADEYALLCGFWKLVRQSPVIVGFNSHGFDFPFLLIRSLILGVEPGVRVADYLRRYTYTPHFDVRMALTGWDVRQPGTLADWAKAFGVAGKSGHGSEVYGMVLEGRWDDLSNYCLADVAVTRALAQRVGPAYGVEVRDA